MTATGRGSIKAMKRKNTKRRHPQSLPTHAPRLVPREPLPPYTVVPGPTPHPVSDRAGHSFGVNPPVPDKSRPDNWNTNNAYLFCVDLFNAGYYWARHGQWERL